VPPRNTSLIPLLLNLCKSTGDTDSDNTNSVVTDIDA